MISDALTLDEALRRQYADHGLPPDGGEGDDSFQVRIGALTIRLPNPPARKRAVFFHDTNHVLTGYNTIFSQGEMLIAAFELGAGCGRYWFAWLINLSMFGLGIILQPHAMFRAFLRGRRTTRSIYCRPESRGTLSVMTVADLRALTGLDDKSASAPLDRFLFVTWGVCGVLTIIAPLAAVIWGLSRVPGLRR